MTEEIVSWATPLTRAEAAAREAAVHFEFGRWKVGVEELVKAKAHYDQAIKFVFDKHFNGEEVPRV